MAQVIIDYEEYQELLAVKNNDEGYKKTWSALLEKVNGLEEKRVIHDDIVSFKKVMVVGISKKRLMELIDAPEETSEGRIDIQLV